MDAVYLAVPHHLHYGMIATAVAAGIPVFTEKPITRTVAEGQNIAEIARTRRVKVGVNYQYRYDSGCHRLARAVQNGDLGEIHAARINVPWHRGADYFAKSTWHSKLATAGGGTLITQASHFLDVILWALRDDTPQSAVGYTKRRKYKTYQTPGGQGEIEVEDLAQAIVEMESGALIQISSSMIASSEQAVRVEVYGEQGTAVYSPVPLPHVTFRDVQIQPEKPPHRGAHALQRSLEGFRAWIMEDRPFLIPAHEALPALSVVEAIYKSAQSGKKEPVEK
jgi:predicted dehydrogenase